MSLDGVGRFARDNPQAGRRVIANSACRLDGGHAKLHRQGSAALVRSEMIRCGYGGF
jgi:hypothetical protein